MKVRAFFQSPIDLGASTLGSLWAMLLAITTGSNMALVMVWAAFVVLDFASAGLRVFLDDSQQWSGRRALKGAAKKAGYFLSANVAALLDILANILISPGIMAVSPTTKAMLILLIGIETGSVARNLLAVTGEWRIYQLMMRARDQMRSGGAPHRRWYDDKDTNREGGEP